MSDLIVYRLNEALWRCWYKTSPEANFTVDTQIGLCSCREREGCVHLEIVRDYSEAPGLPREKAREVTKATLQAFREDPWVRYAKVKDSRKNAKGWITHVHFEVGFRGRGKPMSFEGKRRGLNMVFDSLFHINESEEPVEKAFRLEKPGSGWEKVL